MSYINYTDFLREADIILTYNRKSLLHRLVAKFFSKKDQFKAGHALLYLYNDIVSEAGATGVSNIIFPKYKKDQYKIYILRYKNITAELKVNIIGSAISKAGTKYSYFQLLLFLIKYIFKLKQIGDASRKAMVCSEAVAQIYKNAGIDLFPGKESYEITPEDFFDAEDLEIVAICL